MRLYAVQSKMQRVMKMKKNSTLAELLAGILLVGVIEQIVCLIFFENHVYNAVGLWSGVLLSVGLAIHMQRSVEDALDLDADSADKHMRKSYMTRALAASVVIGVVIYYEWGNPLTVLAGIFALKLAAYLQPFMHKAFERRLKRL